MGEGGVHRFIVGPILRKLQCLEDVSFTLAAWGRNSALFESICGMPFNKELQAGSLSPEQFKHYILQDIHYLQVRRQITCN
jgi:thiaminase